MSTIDTNDTMANERDYSEQSKLYLQKVFASEMALKCLRERIYKLRETLGIKGVNFDKEPSSGTAPTDKQQRVIAEIVSLEMELEEKKLQHLKLVEEVSNAINKVADTKCRTVLQLRHISGMKMWKIARELHYDERQVFRIYAKALILFYDVIKCQC